MVYGSVIRIIYGAASVRLPAQQCAATVAAGAPVDILFFSRCIFGREGRVSKGLPPQGNHIEIALLDGRIAQSKQTAFFGGHARKRTALSQKRQSAADHGGFRPQGLSKEFGGGHMLGNDTGTAVVGAHQLPSSRAISI